MALLSSDLRLKLLVVPADFSAPSLDEREGLRVLDMVLLCHVRIDVSHEQTSSKYLRRIRYTQTRLHAAHHTPSACRRDEDFVCANSRSIRVIWLAIAAGAAKRFNLSYNISFGLQ
jgi:hypothetical protein